MNIKTEMMINIATQNSSLIKGRGVGVTRKEQGEEGNFFTEKRIKKKKRI